MGWAIIISAIILFYGCLKIAAELGDISTTLFGIKRQMDDVWIKFDMLEGAVTRLRPQDDERVPGP